MNTGILFLRLIATSIIGLFSSRFVIQNLGTSDYGLYSVVGGAVMLLAFLNTVMTAATYRFIAYELGRGDESVIREIFNISKTIHILMAVLLILLTETVGIHYVYNYLNIEQNRISDAAFVLRFSSLTTVFSILCIPYQGLITALEKFSVRSGVEVLRSLLAFITAVCLFLPIKNKLIIYSLLIAIVNVFPLIIYHYYVRKKYKNLTIWCFSKNVVQYKRMLTFSIWTTLGAASSVGQTSGMALIINTFFGTFLNAAFGIARQLNGLISMFSQTLAQAAIPQITKNYSGGNFERSTTLVVYMAKYTWFLIAIPSLPILLETKFLLDIWLKDVPEHAAFFVQLLVINLLILGLGNGLSSIFQANGKIKYYQITQSFTTLLIIPASYIIFQLNYSVGMLMPVYIILSIINLISSIILSKIIINFDINYFIKYSIFKILTVSLAISPLFLIRNFFPVGILRLALLSIGGLLYFVSAIYFLALDDKEKVFFFYIAKHLYKKVIR